VLAHRLVVHQADAGDRAALDVVAEIVARTPVPLTGA
jgi:hypothetical protein